MKKRNQIAKDLFSTKYRKRVIKPKKAREVLEEKKYFNFARKQKLIP